MSRIFKVNHEICIPKSDTSMSSLKYPINFDGIIKPIDCRDCSNILFAGLMLTSSHSFHKTYHD